MKEFLGFVAACAAGAGVAVLMVWVLNGGELAQKQAKTRDAFGGIPVRGHLAAVVCLDPKAQK